MRKLIVSLLSFISLITINVFANDAPSISSVTGDLIQGNTITVDGANFGNFNISNILLWDNFDEGTEYHRITGNPTLGNWELQDSTICGWCVTNHYSSIAHHGLSSMATDPHGNFSGQFDTLIPHTLRNLYISYWYRFNYNINDGVTKVFQLWGTEPWVCDYDPGVFSGGNIDDWWASLIGKDDCSDFHRVDWMCDIPHINEWHHFEAILYQSDDNITNGSIVLKNDNCVIYNEQNIVTRTGSNQFWDTFFYFYGMKNFSDQRVTCYVDDAYASNGWSRIMLGDNPVWSNCVKTEIEPAYSWTDNNLTFKVNQGSFNNGDLCYLYVFDQNGNVNQNGFPLTFGGVVDNINDNRYAQNSFEQKIVVLNGQPISNIRYINNDNSKLTTAHIYDITGKEINTITITSKLYWNGKDKDGKRVKSGIYLIRIR